MGKVTVFPKDTGVNPWFETASNKDRRFTDISKLQDEYDYVIVGAGFGGVSAAFRLAHNDPKAKIALFDALKVGTFSSGRNAGFLYISQLSTPLVGPDRFTLDDQKMLIHLNTVVTKRITDIIESKKLDLDFSWDGMYHAVREKRNERALKELAAGYDEAGIKYSWVKGEELRKRLGTDFYTQAIFTEDCALDNPAELIRGLALALPENVSLFEQTPVAEVKEGKTPYVVLKDGRAIKAGKIILTVNAFIKNFGFGNREITNVSAIQSFGAMTRVLNDEELKDFEGVKSWGIVATHPAGATVRFTSKKRIFVRTDIAYAPSSRLNIPEKRFEQAKPLLRNAFEKRFPKLTHVPFEYEYGGLIAFTGNTVPLFGEIAANVYAGTTSDGTGVTRASILGNYLADLIQGVDSPELNYIKEKYHPSYLPPEILRTPGAEAALWWKNVKAGSEL